MSNWDSYTLSVVDVQKSKQIKQIYLGPYPRGIAVSPDSKTAYVAVMGSYDIAKVDLTDVPRELDPRGRLRARATSS